MGYGGGCYFDFIPRLHFSFAWGYLFILLVAT